MILGFLATLFILSILVLIHEAGHFFVAKWFGIKVEEFGFGLPPRAWGKKVGETIYSINWLPIGGFVKLFGEDEAGAGRVELPKEQHHKKVSKAELDRAFFSRPVWQRAAVVVAGVVMNALLAFFIYYLFLGISGFKTELPLLNDHTFFGVTQTNRLDGLIIARVVPKSPAASAGLSSCSKEACYKIIGINGTSLTRSEDFVQTVRAMRGKNISVAVTNLTTNITKTISMIPRVNPPKGEGSLGIEFGANDVAVLEYKTPQQKILSGITHPLNLMAYNYELMKMLFQRSVEQNDPGPISQAVSGPLGVFAIGGEIGKIPMLKEKILQFLNLAGILSMSLAFFNVLPIPALDGGRLFFILIEGIFRKKVHANIENYAHTIGMALLIGLILLVTLKDIFQLF